MVWLAVVGMAAILFFPTFASDDFGGRPPVACLSNLKQTSLATIMYSGDYNRIVWYVVAEGSPKS